MRFTKAQHERRVKARLGTRKDATRKAWLASRESLRRLVAGDLGEVVGRMNTFAGKDPKIAVNAPSDTRGDISNDAVYEGMSNHMRSNLAILMRQVAFKSPDIQIENTDAISALVHSLYLQTRMGPRPFGCEGASVMEKTLLETLICGIGWATIAFDKGMPIISHIRLEDISWDRTAQTLDDIRWVSIKRKETLGYWLEMFSSDTSKFKKFITDDGPCFDKNIELEFYYDIEGDSGHSAIYILDEDIPATEIEFTDNPFFYDVDGHRFPFLPATAMVYQQTPGVMWPTGLVDDMLPHQLQVWRDERRIHNLVLLGDPKVIMSEGTFTGASQKDFMSPSDIPKVLFVTEGVQPQNAYAVMHGLDIPQSLQYNKDSNSREIGRQAGVTEYSAGGAVPGVRFATEASAINEQGDLNSQSITAMYVKVWKEVLKKYLGACAAYDDAPCRIVYDDVSITFGPNNPVANYIDTGVEIIVQESGVQFKTPSTRMMEAQMLLQASVAVQGIYPGAIGKAFEKILLASGERNPTVWMEQPSQQASTVNSMMDGQTLGTPG